jgi:hypothetical protein
MWLQDVELRDVPPILAVAIFFLAFILCLIRCGRKIIRRGYYGCWSVLAGVVSLSAGISIAAFAAKLSAADWELRLIGWAASCAITFILPA